MGGKQIELTFKSGECMKIWVDDVRPAPESYIRCKSVNATKECINQIEGCYPDEEVELIDIDHDAGDFKTDGGDYIKILDWLEETGRNYPIRIHSMNPVGVQNMRRIIERNGWR